AASLGAAAIDCYFAADDWLHARGAAGYREFERTEQVAAVGDRDRRHPLGLAEAGQLLDPDRTGGERVGGMNAKVDKIGERHGVRIACPTPPVSQAARNSGNQPGISCEKSNGRSRGFAAPPSPNRGRTN